jgi:hypothetical protein
MLSGKKKYLLVCCCFVLFMLTMQTSFSQQPAAPSPSAATAPSGITTNDSMPPMPQYGPNDTIVVPAHIYKGEFLSSRNLDYAWVLIPMSPAMKRHYEEWTRLRNAVYVTYPYARKAGIILNDMNAKLATLTSESEKQSYLKSREKDLKKEFTDPMEKLSIYQGKILMKLINRQTGNNCYDIIKEYRGGFSARLWQTVAFFFGSSLKQPYDSKGEDQQIESIVQEVEKMYRG